MMIPANVGDIIKKIGDHYISEFKNGEHFVVIEVYNGDDTAVVLKTDGTIGTLCFPEEYEVVATVKELVAAYHNKIPVTRETNEELDEWYENNFSKPRK